MAQDCIFCQIGDGRTKSDILYRDDNCFVIKDIAPKAPVHMLIIPARHFTHLANLTPEDYAMVGGLFMAARKLAERDGLDATGYRLVINQGSDAGQAVDHLHLHLLAGRRLGSMG
jgi:diadenosine tetraphosphate (Ap4A) HIT family hydrolase